MSDPIPTEDTPTGYADVVVPIADPLDEPPGNEDDEGVRHFCVIPPRGEEFCGGCGEVWPCDHAQRLDVHLLPPQE